jgi:hypothetical protein
LMALPNLIVATPVTVAPFDLPRRPDEEISKMKILPARICAVLPPRFVTGYAA